MAVEEGRQVAKDAEDVGRDEVDLPFLLGEGPGAPGAQRAVAAGPVILW